MSFEFDYSNAAIAINDTAAVESESAAGGQMSYFSSWGPTLLNRMAPQISAPGIVFTQAMD